MKPKEILVFGASGQIGRNLIRKLTKNNYKVIAVTRNIHHKGYMLKTQALLVPAYHHFINIFTMNRNYLKELVQVRGLSYHLMVI